MTDVDAIDIAALIAEVRRCHARLEIDHAWRPARDGETPERDGMMREPIPYDRRASETDGIECRDATIAQLQEMLAYERDTNRRLREAMPSDEDLEAVRTCIAHAAFSHNRPRYVRFTAANAISRLDAARKGGG